MTRRLPPRRARLGLLLAVCGAFGVACTDEGITPPPVHIENDPELIRLQPSSGAPGDTVAASGQRFGDRRGEGALWFGPLAAEIVSWSDSLIIASVPEDAQTGPVTVVDDDGAESVALTFGISVVAVSPPVLAELVPMRTVRGDTLTIDGTDFPGDPADGLVIFSGDAGGEVVADQIIRWTASQARVIVPDGAGGGPVRVRTSGGDSNALQFEVAPALISFTSDVQPIFTRPSTGCASCHGGSGGFFLGTHANLMRGDSDHGPVILPRRSLASVLILKLTDPPFGERMPLGGTPLPAADVAKIADWIDQGARNN